MKNYMNVAKMIKELEKMGFKVDARRRSDGGWIITKINDMSFSGASGNAYARQVLGIELSQARIEQVKFNVEKYIKGSRKPKDKLDEELNKKLKSVQAKWRKKQVKGRITKRKLRWHLKQGGRREAEEYLSKMGRYGEGYAYEENVEYLARYIEDIARGYITDDSELQEASLKVAGYVRSKAETFRESWISSVYAFWYEVRDRREKGVPSKEIVPQAIMKTYSTIG